MPLAPTVALDWDDGVLRASAPDLSGTWTRPADLAAARLAVAPPPGVLVLDDGRDLLTAAFAVVPFVRGPLPAPVYGASVTAAARAAFDLFLGHAARPDSVLRVLRGELDDFLVCARMDGSVWTVGAFAAGSTTLTVRFEDLWRQLPPPFRCYDYRADVLRDPHAKDAPEVVAAGLVRETVEGLAPDARICLDVAASGGFLLTFRPMTDNAAGAPRPGL